MINDERLSKILPPHFVQRLSIGVDKLSFWKASLLRNVLHIYALPVLKGMMKDLHFDHFKMFVEAAPLLNSSRQWTSKPYKLP